ncbi:MAG: rubrerythrin [Clostridia bacterium]|nr:rubrerythrin [Clostridia bacterium]
MAELSKELKKFLRFQQGELDGVLTYQTLAGLTDDAELKAAFLEAAADEGRYAAILRNTTREALKPDHEAAANIKMAVQAVGFSALLEKISAVEYAGFDMYAPHLDYPNVSEMQKDEKKHGDMMAAQAKSLGS